ncbi:MAG: cytochrome c biogenesis CcdA family protein [Frankia sp.]
MSVAAFVSDGPLLLAAPVAAAAGLISFLSPCVLPLVPGYLSYVTGLSGQDLAAAPPAAADRGAASRPVDPARLPVGVGAATNTATATATTTTGGGITSTDVGSSAPGRADEPARTDLAAPGRPRRWRAGRVAAGSILFVLGFTAVFVSYGALFGDLGRRLVLHQRGVDQILGAVTIVMGLTFAGLFSRFSAANREWRIHRLPAPGLLGAPLLGALFGIGWTPCLGPTLTTVQGLAINSATAGRGAFLSAAYCLGLGVPFVAVGLGFRRAAGTLAVVRRHARVLTFVGGLLLVAVGVLELTGAWDTLIIDLRGWAPGFGETPL